MNETRYHVVQYRHGRFDAILSGMGKTRGTDSDHYEYKIAEHYLSALIDGDETGLEDDEQTQFEQWESRARADAIAAGYTIGHWTEVEDSGGDWGICKVSGLFAMRCTVRLMIYKQDAAPCAR